MTLIQKRTGEMEPFDPEKLEMSIQMAGVNPVVAREVVKRIHAVDGMSTGLIRKKVYEELRKVNPVAAQRYMRTFRFTTCRSDNARKGVALVSRNSLRRMRILVGSTFHLEHAGKIYRMVAGETDIPDNEVCLHEEDLRELGIDEGVKVTSKQSRSESSDDPEVSEDGPEPA